MTSKAGFVSPMLEMQGESRFSRNNSAEGSIYQISSVSCSRDFKVQGGSKFTGYYRVEGSGNRLYFNVGENQPCRNNSIDDHLGRQAVSDARRGLEAIDSSVFTNKESKCLQKLFTSDYVNDRQHIPKAFDGTCEWVIEHPRFTEWLNAENAVPLWISGNPGMGKTVLSSFIVNYLESLGCGRVVYFFCSSQNQERSHASSILRSVIHQLVNNAPKLFRKHVMSKYRVQGDKLYRSITSLWQIFVNIIQDLDQNQTYFILDGLDECERESREELLGLLREHLSENQLEKDQKGLRTVVTSRPDVSILCLFSNFSAVIRLKAEEEEYNINRDISKFVDHKVQRLAQVLKYSSDLSKNISTKLKNGADGMFLWVVLMIGILKETPSGSAESKLNDIPQGMDGVYLRVLQETSKRWNEDISKILMWITYASQPLSLKAIGIARQIRPDDQSISALSAEDLRGVRGDIEFCQPLLKIESDESVHFVHQSAKQFLLRFRGSNPLIAQHIPIESVAHYEMSVACLTYISREDISEGPLRATEKEEYKKDYQLLLDKHPFLEYACSFWDQHVLSAQQHSEELWETIQKVFRVIDRLEIAFQVRAFSNKKHYARGRSFLCLLVCCGLEAYIRRLLSMGNIEVNDRDTEGFGSLHAAAASGHEGIFKLLLDNGADLTITTNEGVSLLHVATNMGRESIVKLLLERGADVAAKDKYDWTPLHAAAGNGSEAVFKLLLGNGADLSAKTHKDITLLHLAAANGREAVVKLLLEKGADVAAKDKDGWTPLHDAATNGSEAVFKLLLDNGADLFAKTHRDTTLLHLAAANGREAVVKLLLEKGADVAAKSKDGWSPLHAAALNGNEVIVKLLLEKGADITAKDKDGWAPLHNAAENGSEAVFKLLLGNGADLSAKTHKDITLLHLAAANGREAVVKLLLEKGADVAAKSKDGWSPLHAAALNGNEVIVKLLLEKGADITAKDKDGWAPLHAAAENGSETVFRLLLSGADLTAKTKKDTTLLHIVKGVRMGRRD